MPRFELHELVDNDELVNQLHDRVAFSASLLIAGLEQSGEWQTFMSRLRHHGVDVVSGRMAAVAAISTRPEIRTVLRAMHDASDAVRAPEIAKRFLAPDEFDDIVDVCIALSDWNDVAAISENVRKRLSVFRSIAETTDDDSRGQMLLAAYVLLCLASMLSVMRGPSDVPMA